jgi:hypothetical protein
MPPADNAGERTTLPLTPASFHARLRKTHVHPSYGRKGHLKAIWARTEDGNSPVQTRAQAGTRYSFPENLDSGQRCWKLRRLDRRDEDGTPVNTRGIFLQVLVDCLVR